MTRTHAAYQLLRHGPLNSVEFKEITGWNTNSCEAVLKSLRRRGKIRLVCKGTGGRDGKCSKRSIYEVIR